MEDKISVTIIEDHQPIKVHVFHKEALNKTFPLMREAIIYRAGLKVIYGTNYPIVITDREGYIVPESEIKKWIRRM